MKSRSLTPVRRRRDRFPSVLRASGMTGEGGAAKRQWTDPTKTPNGAMVNRAKGSAS
jgi:hypothetical protein